MQVADCFRFTDSKTLLPAAVRMQSCIVPPPRRPIDGLVESWSENIFVSFCLRAPAGYGLTLWCALGLLVGGAIQVPQLQLQKGLEDVEMFEEVHEAGACLLDYMHNK